jgi:hemoglobin-like flavoprotein
MTPEQTLLVQASFAKVAPIASTAADLFYDRLFTLDPSLRPLFKPDMTAQKRALMGMLGVAVAGLDRLDELVPAVQQLGRRHAGYGVTEAHYATVGDALLWTLEQGLGADFTPDTRAAWAAVYTLLAATMQTGGQAAAVEGLTPA